MERIPKNIRQIGGREERLKTYVEDYVSTYLRKLQEEREENGAVGMLTGQWQEEAGSSCVFIGGAAEMRGAHTDGGRLHMTDAAWDDIYESLGTYFSGQELCGIFVCEGTCRRFRRQSLFAAVRESFPDSEQALLFVLTEEGEEIFYRITRKNEERLQGYFCYFERNEAMQEYMMEHLNQRQVEKEELPGRRQREEVVTADRLREPPRGSEGALGDDPVDSFRERMRRQQEEREAAENGNGTERKGGRGIFGLCAVMAVVVFVSGFLLMQREQGGIRISDILKELQIDPSQLLAVSGQPEGSTEETLIQSRPVVVEEIPGNVYPTEGDKPVAQPSGGDGSGGGENPDGAQEAEGQSGTPGEEGQPSDGGLSEENGAEGESAAGNPTEAGQAAGEGASGNEAAEGSPDGAGGQPAEGAVPETAPAAEAPPETEAPAETAASTGVTYIVEPGDSLYSISRKFYGTEAMVSKIQELNGLSNADLIKEGQSLLLP